MGSGRGAFKNIETTGAHQNTMMRNNAGFVRDITVALPTMEQAGGPRLKYRNSI